MVTGTNTNIPVNGSYTTPLYDASIVMSEKSKGVSPNLWLTFMAIIEGADCESFCEVVKLV